MRDQVEIACPNGCAVLVDRSAEGTRISCPQCGASIFVPPIFIGEEKRHFGPRRPDPRLPVFAAAGIIALMAAVVLAVVKLQSVPEEEPAPRPAHTSPEPLPTPTPAPVTQPEPAAQPAPAPPVTAPAPAGAPPADRSVRLARIARDAATANYLAIARAIAFYADDQEKLAEVDAILERVCAEIDADVAAITAEWGRPAVPPHLRADETILYFQGASLVHLRRSEAVRRLNSFWTKLTDLESQCATLGYQREREMRQDFVQFPFRPPDKMRLDLSATVRKGLGRSDSVGGAPGGAEPETAAAPAYEPPPEDIVRPMPKDLLFRVEDEIFGLHPYYFAACFPMPERLRLQEILNRGKGTYADEDFLRQSLDSEAMRFVREERRFFEERAEEMSGTALKEPAGDRVRMADGREVTGDVLEANANHVRLATRWGVITYPRGDVREIQRGKTPIPEFRKRAPGALKGSGKELEELSRWCDTNGLETQRDWLCYEILSREPDNSYARMSLGFARAGDVWLAEADFRKAEGKIKFEGRWFAPAELKEHLLTRGYHFHEGMWFKSRPWTYRIDTLWTASPPELIAGSVRSVNETRSDMRLDISKKLWFETKKVFPVLKFLGAGRARITITAPGGIVSARLRAVGTVIDGKGRIEVTAQGAAGRTRVYSLDGGTHSGFHDISQTVRGGNTIVIEATISDTAGGDPHALFLPSEKNTSGVFVLRAEILEHAPKVDRAFQD